MELETVVTVWTTCPGDPERHFVKSEKKLEKIVYALLEQEKTFQVELFDYPIIIIETAHNCLYYGTGKRGEEIDYCVSVDHSFDKVFPWLPDGNRANHSIRALYVKLNEKLKESGDTRRVRI